MFYVAVILIAIKLAGCSYPLSFSRELLDMRLRTQVCGYCCMRYQIQCRPGLPLLVCPHLGRQCARQRQAVTIAQGQQSLPHLVIEGDDIADNEVTIICGCSHLAGDIDRAILPCAFFDLAVNASGYECVYHGVLLSCVGVD